MPRLVVNPGSASPVQIQLKPGCTRIGRSSANDLQISDPSISSTHCEISVNGDSASIRDLGSTNGTFVDRRPVTQADLPPACLLRLGQVELQFCDDDAVPGEKRVGAAAASPGFGVPPKPVPQATLPQATTDRTVLTSPPETLRPLQHCRFHPAMPARFLCTRCGHYFCEACVANRGAVGAQQKFCRHCGVPCTPVDVQYKTVREKGYLERLPGAFLYPVRGAGVIIVIVGIVLVGMMKGGHALFQFGGIRPIIFGTIIEIFAGGYLFAYLQGIVHSTAAEDRELPDLPGISNFLEDVLVPFFRLLGLTVLCLGPAVAAAIWWAAAGTAQARYILLACAVLGVLYYPMAFLAVAILDSLGAANPLIVVPAIVRLPGKYLLSLVPLVGMAAVQWFGAWSLHRLFPERWTTHEMGAFMAMISIMGLLSFLTLYLLVLSVHLLGLIFVTSKSELRLLGRSGANV